VARCQRASGFDDAEFATGDALTWLKERVLTAFLFADLHSVARAVQRAPPVQATTAPNHPFPNLVASPPNRGVSGDVRPGAAFRPSPPSPWQGASPSVHSAG